SKIFCKGTVLHILSEQVVIICMNADPNVLCLALLGHYSYWLRLKLLISNYNLKLPSLCTDSLSLFLSLSLSLSLNGSPPPPLHDMDLHAELPSDVWGWEQRVGSRSIM